MGTTDHPTESRRREARLPDRASAGKDRSTSAAAPGGCSTS